MSFERPILIAIAALMLCIMIVMLPIAVLVLFGSTGSISVRAGRRSSGKMATADNHDASMSGMYDVIDVLERPDSAAPGNIGLTIVHSSDVVADPTDSESSRPDVP